MIEAVKLEVIKRLDLLKIAEDEVPKPDDQLHVENVRLQHPNADGAGDEDPPGDDAKVPAKQQPTVRHTEKVGRNDPCPCGSGKKYKHCHGKLT